MTLRKRLLLWLPVAIFAGLWAATAWWGTADVERHIIAEHIRLRRFAHLYPLSPKDYRRVEWGEMGTRHERAWYSFKTYSPFPLVVVCRYEVTRNGLNHYKARQRSFWIAGHIVEGDDRDVVARNIREYWTLGSFVRSLLGGYCG